MNEFKLEKVLWDFGNDPSRIARFRDAPDSYLAEYRLDEEDSRIVKEMDVRTMAERRVSALLTMMTWMLLRGPDAMGEYLQKMNAPRSAK